jgi:hypothetical protein
MDPRAEFVITNAKSKPGEVRQPNKFTLKNIE